MQSLSPARRAQFLRGGRSRRVAGPATRSGRSRPGRPGHHPDLLEGVLADQVAQALQDLGPATASPRGARRHPRPSLRRTRRRRARPRSRGPSRRRRSPATRAAACRADIGPFRRIARTAAGAAADRESTRSIVSCRDRSWATRVAAVRHPRFGLSAPGRPADRRRCRLRGAAGRRRRAAARRRGAGRLRREGRRATRPGRAAAPAGRGGARRRHGRGRRRRAFSASRPTTRTRRGCCGCCRAAPTRC